VSTFSVRGTLSFWNDLEQLQGDARRDQVLDIAFRVAEGGPTNVAGARAARYPFGTGWRDGFTLPLPHEAGFVPCVGLEDPVTGEQFYALLYVILTDADAEDDP
jgi:hypothetical protein